MATNERRIDPSVAAVKSAGTHRLLEKLEAALHAGTVKPVSPDSKPVTMTIRVKSP